MGFETVTVPSAKGTPTKVVRESQPAGPLETATVPSAKGTPTKVVRNKSSRGGDRVELNSGGRQPSKQTLGVPLVAPPGKVIATGPKGHRYITDPAPKPNPEPRRGPKGHIISEPTTPPTVKNDKGSPHSTHQEPLVAPPGKVIATGPKGHRYITDPAPKPNPEPRRGPKGHIISEPTTPPTVKNDQRKVYTVKKGDNLSVIAREHGIEWQSIYKYNKKTIGTNPDLLTAGIALSIPSQATVLADKVLEKLDRGQARVNQMRAILNKPGTGENASPVDIAAAVSKIEALNMLTQQLQ